MFKFTTGALKRLVMATVLLITGLSTAIAQPIIVSPTAEDIIDTVSVPFSWDSNGTAVTAWWLYVGAEEDTRTYFDSKALGLATSVLATGMPFDQETVIATLWYREEGVVGWQKVYGEYAVDMMDVQTPTITNPTVTEEFLGNITWDANFSPVQAWWINLGVQPGAGAGESTFYSSGVLSADETGVETGILYPTPYQVTIYATLWYRINGVWSSTSVPIQSRGSLTTGDEQYFDVVEVNGSNSFRDSGKIFGTNPILTLTDPGFEAVANWWVYVGSTPGGFEYFDSENLPPDPASETFSIEVQANSLPVDGSKVFLTVWYQLVEDNKWYRQTFELDSEMLIQAQQ